MAQPTKNDEDDGWTITYKNGYEIKTKGNRTIKIKRTYDANGNVKSVSSTDSTKLIPRNQSNQDRIQNTNNTHPQNNIKLLGNTKMMGNYINAKPSEQKEPQNSFQGVGNSLIDNKHKKSIYDEVKPKNISIDNNDEVISMQIVLLNGKKQTIKMNGNNHTINDLYALVKSIYDPGRFELLQGFPPKSLNDGTISLSSAGLKQQRIIQKKLKNIPNMNSNKNIGINNNKVACPICSQLFHPNIINAHLDQCISAPKSNQTIKPSISQKNEEQKNDCNVSDEIKKLTQLVTELDIKRSQQKINVIDYKKKEYDGIIPYVGFLVGLSMMQISLDVNNEIFSSSKEDPFKYFTDHWSEYDDNKKKSIHSNISGQIMTEKDFNENGERNDSNSGVTIVSYSSSSDSEQNESKNLIKKYKKLNNLEKKVYLLKYFMFIGTDLNRISDDNIDPNKMNENEIKQQNMMLNGGFASMMGGMMGGMMNAMGGGGDAGDQEQCKQM